MYHSAEQNVVYLNLVSIHDSDVFADMVEGLDPNMNHSVSLFLSLAPPSPASLLSHRWCWHTCRTFTSYWRRRSITT